MRRFTQKPSWAQTARSNMLYFWNGTLLFKGGVLAKGPACCCACVGCVPSCANDRANLLVTFHSTDCPAVEGQTRTLVWNAGLAKWIYTNAADACFCDVEITVHETCSLCPQPSGVGIYIFNMVSWCWEDPGTGMRPGSAAGCPNLTTSTCSPFLLKYPETGAFCVQWMPGDGCNCTSGDCFTVDVTCA